MCIFRFIFVFFFSHNCNKFFFLPCFIISICFKLNGNLFRMPITGSSHKIITKKNLSLTLFKNFLPLFYCKSKKKTKALRFGFLKGSLGSNSCPCFNTKSGLFSFSLFNENLFIWLSVFFPRSWRKTRKDYIKCCQARRINNEAHN